MAKLKIKVSCAGVLDRATVPFAVLVADLQYVGKPATRTRYVLLDLELRNALSHMRDDNGRARGGERLAYLGDVHKIIDVERPFPTLIRPHAFRADGTIHDPQEPISRRAGTWNNAETLWVRADLAGVVLADLAEWRKNTPEREDYINAPSWNALVGVQALCCAAEMDCRTPAPTDAQVCNAG